ncbi:cupin domain-containing protein [Candidatus Woesebacteria bacterium]|nr:cupin domain-containing protein [Candidatus Woesebacteria bacterium]
MIGHVGNIEDETEKNNYFRKVIFTSGHTQLVVMALQVGEDIGVETHKENDQFFRLESGMLKIVMNGEQSTLTAGMAAIVPAGTEHNVINIGSEVAKLYTLYSPAHHPDGTIHKTKAEAMAGE